MARWFFFTVVVACLVCFVQAFPQADTASGTTAATPASKVGEAFNEIAQSLQQGLQKIMEDPNINKLVTDGQKYLQNAATAIQNEAAKIVPKTSDH